MTTVVGKYFEELDWKKAYAIIVVYGYAYDILFWPFAFWGSTLATVLSGTQWPAPPLVPWEQLAVATANLAVIGAIQLRRDKVAADAGNSVTEKTVTQTEVKVNEDKGRVSSKTRKEVGG